MSAAALTAAWKSYVAGPPPAASAPAPAPAAPAWHRFAPCPAGGEGTCLCGEASTHPIHNPPPTGFTYQLARATDGQRPPCVLKGDPTQPCNDEGGTYIATRSDGRQQRICARHASRLATAKGLAFPPAGAR